MDSKDVKYKEKKLYFYNNKDGKKDRQKGIIRYYEAGWDTFEENKNSFIKANFIEILFYRFRQLWSSFNTFQKIQIILTLIAIIIPILIAALSKK